MMTLKPLLILSACLALMLTACSKDSTTDIEQTKANNDTEQVQTIRIAAAANLSDVLPDIIEGYKTDNDLPTTEIEVTYASSGKLYAQIISGAPYDIFLSANQEFPAKLVNEKLADQPSFDKKQSQPFTYTQGQLALYSVNHSLSDIDAASLNKVLTTASKGKVAIANPELAPYGASAKVYLQQQNIYDSLLEQKRLIQAENIGQAFQYAHTGNVDYGFVAQSQLTAIKATPTQFYTLAPASYPAILQDGMVLSNNSVAIDFSNYLRSEVGQKYFAEAGYLAVK